MSSNLIIWFCLTFWIVCKSIPPYFLLYVSFCVSLFSFLCFHFYRSTSDWWYVTSVFSLLSFYVCRNVTFTVVHVCLLSFNGLFLFYCFSVFSLSSLISKEKKTFGVSGSSLIFIIILYH